MEYFSKAIALLQELEKTQGDKLAEAAQVVAQATCNDGLIYIFGCGHSHILAEECFYRAGGLANVFGIFEPSLMLHVSASKSSILEKKDGIAEGVLKNYKITKNDVVIVISTSGINGVPIEMALMAKNFTKAIITISSYNYSKEKVRSKHNVRLSDIGAINIDNLVPKGDGCIKLAKEGSACPLSTISGTAILNSIIEGAIRIMETNNFEPPIFNSGNIIGSEQHNSKLLNKYQQRIVNL